MMSKLFAFVLFVLTASYAHASSETNLNWGLSAGSEPRSVCVYDTSHICVATGTLNSSTHAFTPNNSTFTQTIGAGGVSQTVTAKLLSRPIDPDDYGTVDRTGASDMGALLNTVIARAKGCSPTSAANSTIRLKAGTYLITTPIVPKSCVSIVGDGRGKTILKTNTNTPLVQTAGTQVVFFNLSGVTFQDSGAHPSAVVMNFSAIQGSVISNIGFHGYTSGTLFNIASNGTLVSSYDVTTGVWASSNSIFNSFEDWVADDGAATGISLAGWTTVPCGINNFTTVVTQNTFSDIILWGITKVGIQFVRGADTNYVRHLVISMKGSGARVISPQSSLTNIGIQMGADMDTCTANNDVVGNTIELSLSSISPATSTSILNSGNDNFGNFISLQGDTALGTSAITAAAGVTGVNDVFTGGNFLTAFGVGTQIAISNAQYYSVGDGALALPIWAFNSDGTNGLYKAGTGLLGISQSLQVNKHLTGGSTTPSISSCGSGPTITGSDMAFKFTIGTTNTTACTVTFAAAYAVTPICVASPRGWADATFQINSVSTSGIVFAYSSTNTRQVSVVCMGQAGG